jgi:ribosomal protein L24E
MSINFDQKCSICEKKQERFKGVFFIFDQKDTLRFCSSKCKKFYFHKNKKSLQVK